MKAIKAYEAEGRPRATIYEFSNGRKEKWIGGTPAWRNNNPGNLRPAKAHPGQIGEAWTFAVFPDWETGKIAIVAQLRRPLYYNLTLEEAIYQYAPKKENNPENYTRYVVKRTGFDRKVRLSNLSDSELLKMVNAMIELEHTIQGTVEVLSVGKTGKYIWHTAQDEKVRKDHAERDGKVFDFANPPKGGNPSDDYNCRCWAEPIPQQSLKEVFKK